MATPYRTVRDASVDNSNQVVKTGEGEVAYFILFNAGVVDAFFHLYDDVTANITVGTTVPKATFLVPAGVDSTHAGAYEYLGPPIHFEVGVVYACSTTVAGGTDTSVKPALGSLQYR